MRWHWLLKLRLSLHLVALDGGRLDSLRMGQRDLKGRLPADPPKVLLYWCVSVQSVWEYNEWSRQGSKSRIVTHNPDGAALLRS
jgi:hypothetical protein